MTMVCYTVQRTSSEDVRRHMDEVIDAVSRGEFSSKIDLDDDILMSIQSPPSTAAAAKPPSRKRGRASSHGELQSAKRPAVEAHSSDAGTDEMEHHTTADSSLTAAPGLISLPVMSISNAVVYCHCVVT